MSTAGNLVFGASNEGNFFALDATSGEALWSFYFGAGARTNPMSFRLDSNEYVVFAGGNSIYVFGLSNGQGQ